MNEEKEAAAVLRYIRESPLYEDIDLPMEVTIAYLQAIRRQLDEEISALTEESE